jgi:hypothetical protein
MSVQLIVKIIYTEIIYLLIYYGNLVHVYSCYSFFTADELHSDCLMQKTVHKECKSDEHR